MDVSGQSLWCPDLVVGIDLCYQQPEQQSLIADGA